MKTIIQIEDTITVGDLADRVAIPVTRLIAELMKNGVMVTVNERIDFDTAEIIVNELELDYELERKIDAPTATTVPNNNVRQASDSDEARHPVVAVMGHVDHGKTTLLDAIRKSNTVGEESGGITQHISAYQIEHQGRKITFLDTPGHEAFSAIREHSARLTDVAVIVVAADDGIKPQTIEAIRFARNAGVKLVIAINKIDKPTADLNRLKQQLADNDLLVEEWGGDTIVAPVSALTKEGISELLDMILLVADVEELRANPNAVGQGLVVESHMKRGKGAVAVALVEDGTLSQGDYIVAGATYGRVRSLTTTEGDPIQSAGPSTPVVITGFKSLPEFGDAFMVEKSEKTARNKAKATLAIKKQQSFKTSVNSSELLRIISRSQELRELNIVLKADVQGSLTSVVDSIKSLQTEEVGVRIVSSGVGPINDGDVYTAQAGNAVLYGFRVPILKSAKQAASRDNVQARSYEVIYELLDDVKQELSNLLAPEVRENELGRVVVKGVFKTTRNDVICGGEVTKGKLTLPAYARIVRNKEVVAEAEVVGLQRGPNEAKEVIEGEMCGLHLKTSTKIVLENDDRIELFTRETIKRSL